MSQNQTMEPAGVILDKSILDLNSYLKRINYDGELHANLKTLKSLHFNHSVHIPFENLDALLRNEVKLDISSIEKKLIDDNRGGWCFEQNTLFMSILKSIGFDVRGLAARVKWNVPEEVLTPRSHMLLLVNVEGEKYIADVGFGGLTLTSPLLFACDIEQSTPHETFRLKKTEEEYLLEAKINNEWRPVYLFPLIESLPSDYQVSNWYLCNNPQSPFLKQLIVTKPFAEGRLVLHNAEFKSHYVDGRKDRIMLDSAAALLDTLENTFAIKLEDNAQRAALAEFFESVKASRAT